MENNHDSYLGEVLLRWMLERERAVRVRKSDHDDAMPKDAKLVWRVNGSADRLTGPFRRFATDWYRLPEPKDDKPDTLDRRWSAKFIRWSTPHNRDWFCAATAEKFGLWWDMERIAEAIIRMREDKDGSTTPFSWQSCDHLTLWWVKDFIECGHQVCFSGQRAILLERWPF